MTWLRPENISARNYFHPLELLEEFHSTYGRVGKIIIDAYDEVDPLDAWFSMCEEDYYLGYAEEFIRLVLATPPEYLAQQEVREDLIEITLRHHRRYSPARAWIVAWLITERVNGNDVEMEDWPDWQ